MRDPLRDQISCQPPLAAVSFVSKCCLSYNNEIEVGVYVLVYPASSNYGKCELE